MANLLTTYRGDTKTHTVTVTDSVGSAFDLTGYTVRFSIKEDYDDTDALAKVQKTGVITDAAGGIFTITLTNEDTQIDTGDYLYDMQIDNGSTIVKTIRVGTYTIAQEVTRTSY